MTSRARQWLQKCAVAGLAVLAFLLIAQDAHALAKKMSITGYLAYSDGNPGKRFTWRLRFYEQTGIVLGHGRDVDGYAEFFGTYDRFSKRFRMVKHFKYRRTGVSKFYYNGTLRGGRLYGSAHQRSYWGPRYAGWSATVRYNQWNFTKGGSKRFSLRGRLRYNNGRSKSFYWRLSYYPSSGRCFGTVRDTDGVATFSGVYDRPTKRIFLRKRYDSRRTFYYRGYMTAGGFYGTARKYSFTSRTAYGTWTAKRLWSWQGGGTQPPPADNPPPVDNPPPTDNPPPADNPPPKRMKKFLLRGKLRYLGGNVKRFTWTLRYYPRSGLCFGEVRDTDGYAKFSGTCDPRTGRLRLTKRFMRRGGNNVFYYTGSITKQGARGVARRYGYSGRIYATWKARVVWRYR